FLKTNDMETVHSILKSKVYDSAEIDDIVCSNDNCLDSQVRDFFGIKEPVHLDCFGYYAGDADRDALTRIAIKKGYDGYFGLLTGMDDKLIELAEAVKSKF